MTDEVRLLVCGGRKLNPLKVSIFLYDYCRKLLTNEEKSVMTIIHGDAQGADKGAHYFAEAMGLKELSFPANWEKYGKSAGPKRNRQMLEEASPDLVIAFPGGKGTFNMTELAFDYQIRVDRAVGDFN
jgi:YspA, cpYpsA-related SLOG family